MNKRIDSRFDCCVPLMDEKKEALLSSQTIDISKSGVGFVSARFIPMNTKMTVELSLQRDSMPFLVQGKVKWVEKMPNSSNFRIGMSFPDIPQEAQAQIEDSLKV